MHRNGRLFQSDVTDRLRNLGIPVVPREPEWADRTIGAHVLELGSSVEIAELPDDVIMVSAIEGGSWKLKDVFFDLDEAVDVAGGLYQRREASTHSPNRPARAPRGEGNFATRSAEAKRARPRRRPNARSNEEIVLEAVERAPDHGHGEKWISEVQEESGLPLGEVGAALRQLMIDRKVNLMGDDSANMVKYGAERAEQRRIKQGEISIGGNPRHFVRLVQARKNSRGSSNEALVLAAVRRAPVTGSSGRRLIADVWDDTNLPLEELRSALLELQEQGKIILMRADAVHMDKRGAEAKEAKRMIDAEILVGGNPRHLVFLDGDSESPRRRNGRPVVKHDVEKSIGPAGSRKQPVTVRAGLRVVPITEGSTKGKFWLDEFPESDFPRRSTLRHDAEHYGVVLEASEVEGG
jgi:hypothetical protein